MKLDDRHKKNIFEVPDRYFDELPGRIQSRIQAKNERKPAFWNVYLTPSFKYALPVVILAIVASLLFFRSNQEPLTPDMILAEVESAEIIAYLENTDVTLEDLIEGFEWNQEDLDFLAEESVLLEGIELENSDFDLLLNEYGIEDDVL